MPNPMGGAGSYGGYNYPREVFRTQAGELGALLQSVSQDAVNVYNGVGPLGMPGPNDYINVFGGANDSLWNFSQGLQAMTAQAAADASRYMGPAGAPGMQPNPMAEGPQGQPGGHGAPGEHLQLPEHKTMLDRAVGGVAAGGVLAGLTYGGFALMGAAAGAAASPILLPAVAIAGGIGLLAGAFWP